MAQSSFCCNGFILLWASSNNMYLIRIIKLSEKSRNKLIPSNIVNVNEWNRIYTIRSIFFIPNMTHGGNKMRKFFGYVILIVSLLLGLMLAVLYGEAIIFTCIFFWLICIPMYSWSKYLRSTKYEFKTKIRDSLKRYIYFLFIIPMLFHIGLFYLELKEKAFIDEKYIKYELSASFIGEINFFFILLCGFLFGMRFMSDFKRKRLLNVLIICSAILFIGFSNVTGSQYLLATKKQKEFTISVICGAVVNAVLNYILILKFKALGACIGTVIAEFTVTCVQVYFIKNDFSVTKILKSSLKYFACSLCMFVVSIIIGNVIDSKIISICVQVILGTIVYSGILCVTKDVMIQELKRKILKKV